tara:strand:+ start:347 stop:2257 length:1911 start_codon:yes stop_codon:yes gene_type:complete
MRLASVNDGKFKTAFGNDIDIEPGSKIAVLNATFETIFSNISIGDLNNQVDFISDADLYNDQVGGNTAELPNRQYSGSLGVTQFFRDVNLALNTTLGYKISTVAGGAKEDNSVFSEFQMQYEDNLAEFPEPLIPPVIRYTYNNIVSAFGPTFSMAYPQGSRNSPMLVDGGPGVAYFNYTGSGTPTDAQRFSNQIERTAGQLAAEGTEFRAEPAEGVVMSSGSGLWMCRIGNFVDNGSALQDNGFGFGLSEDLFNVAVEDDIPVAKKYAEVRFNRLLETFKFTSRAGSTATEKDSNILPQRVVAAQPITDHDIMWIRVGRNQRTDQATANDPTYGKYCIQAGVWQDMGSNAVEHIFFSDELDGADLQYEKLHPYFFMNGAPGEIMADAMAFTPSTFHLMDVGGKTEPDWTPYNPDDIPPTGFTQIGTNNYQILDILKNGSGTAYPLSVIGQIVPQNRNDRFNNRTFTTSLIMHRDVWKYLGYGDQFTSMIGYDIIDQKIGDDNLEYRNMIEWVGESGPNLDDDDNFIVESLTLPVDSYDASEQSYGNEDKGGSRPGFDVTAQRLGRRKNIICTIPATDLDGMVNYEASTPQFIDLRNKSTLNERNLEFRILDKNFNNIQTGTNKSILTILLSGPGER